MARTPTFKVQKTASGWKVEIPGRLSSAGKRQRVFFPTRDEAKDYAAGLKSDNRENGEKATVIPPSIAEEALRALALLEPYGLSLLEAVKMAATTKRAELASCEIEDAVDQFLAAKSQRSDAHIKAYGYMKRDLLKSFPDRVLSSISGLELLAHAEKFAPSPAAFNGLSRLIAAFWRWCAKHPRDWCDPKLVEILERKDTTKDEIGVLLADKCEKLLRTAERHYPECVPGFAISLFTGMRKAELARLRASDISAEGISLSAASTKTGHRRFIHMPPELAAWLEAYPVDDTVLPTNWHKKEKAVRRLAGWRVWSDLVEPHTPPQELPEWPHNALRHTHASVHVTMGKPLETLTFEFGHSGGPRVLKGHYVGVMPRAEAEKILTLRPLPKAA